MSIMTIVQITSTPGTTLTPIFTPLWPPSKRAAMTRLPMPPSRMGRIFWGTPASSPMLAEKIDFILNPLFGFSSAEAIGVPVTALGAAGAAVSLTATLASQGLASAEDVAVFTAMCMCWSGYLSTHASMMDSLNCKELIGKAIISHTVGGICAGAAAHWLFVLVSMVL